MLVHPQFDPIAFAIGPVSVRWYGLMYLLGFALFLILSRLRAGDAWRGSCWLQSAFGCVRSAS